MSHMIPSGQYKIKNVLYADRYVYMSESGEVVGHDVGQVIKVDVKDKAQHLATLYDTATKLYLAIDQMGGKVKGQKDAQVLQLSSDDGVRFEIHPKDFNDVWFLADGGNWTTITAQAAPPSDAKYWEFEQA